MKIHTIQVLLIVALMPVSMMIQAISNPIDNKNQDTLKTQIHVEYIKTDADGIRWKDELNQARIIPTADKKGIRITLPNSDTAKVIITDKKGKRIYKTLKYIAPAKIDISDLRKGDYQLILESHQVVVVKTFRK